MASRFVFQIRALVFAAAQPLLSAFSYLNETDEKALSALYARANAVVGFSAILALSAAIGAAPFVGEVWIGESQRMFVVYSVLLAMGWLVNTMALTSYFLAYSMGRVRWSLAAHVVMIVLILVLAPVLGPIWGSVGVVAAMAIGLATSGVIMSGGNGLLTSEPRPVLRVHLALAASAILAALAGVVTYYELRPVAPALVGGLASGAVWLAVVAPAALMHPARKLLTASLPDAHPI